MDVNTDGRGFGQIIVKDTRGCDVIIKRSSANPLDCVWIFCNDVYDVYKNDGEASPHLDRDQAQEVAMALSYFASGLDIPEELASDEEDTGEGIEEGSVYRMVEPPSGCSGWKNRCFYIDKVEGALVLTTILTGVYSRQYRIDIAECTMEKIKNDMMTGREKSMLKQHIKEGKVSD